MNTTETSPTITDHTAVNWTGDPDALSVPDLLRRMDALANYAAARLRPYSDWDASPKDSAEAARALDMWAACRTILSERLSQ